MQLEVGALMSGKVTGITKFGVFVDLGSDMTGMVHISEIAPTYVKEISDHVVMGQQVSVKVLNIDEKGRISLSMKQAAEGSSPSDRSARSGGRYQQGGRSGGQQGGWSGGQQGGWSGGQQSGRSGGQQGSRSGGQQRSGSSEAGGSFDDMLKSFMQSSDEKMSELRRSSGGDHRPRRRK